VLTYTAADATGNSAHFYYTVNVVLIKELFDEATADNSPIGKAPGWSAFAYDVQSGVVTDYTAVGGNGNLPTISQAAGSLGPDGKLGYLVSGDISRVNPGLIWLDTSALLQDYDPTNITFYTKNNNAATCVYIAVRVNTNWYASMVSITDTTAGATWAAQSFDFNRNAASWQTLDPATMSLGGAPLTAPLPNYSISGLGFYFTLASGKVRLDSLLVRGQPATFIPTPPVAGNVSVSPLNPIDGSAWLGTPLTFKVQTLGIAPFSYTWRRDGVAVPGATSNPWMLGSPVLDNSGNYDVIVRNSGGSSTSAVVAVTVTNLTLAVNEHFNQTTNDPGNIGQAPGWHVLAMNITNATVTDFTWNPCPPWSVDFPNLSRSAGADNSIGYFVAGEDSRVNPVFVWCDAPASLRRGQLSTISFYTRNSYWSGVVRVAVQIGSQWYAYAAGASDYSMGTGPWQLQTLDFTMNRDAGLWQTLDPNSLMLGNANTEPLPNLTITGIGFYSDTVGVTGAKNRIDELQVSVVGGGGVPSPASIQPVCIDGAGNLVSRIATSADWDYVLESASSLPAPANGWTSIATTRGTGGVITNLVPVVPGVNQFLRYRLQ
jgi:hypothetical protein